MKLNFNFKKDTSIPKAHFKTTLLNGRRKTTRQREEIFKIFQNSTGHRNLAQIHALVSKRIPRIGYSTVYRTMKLLTELGLAAQRKFADGETRYESISGGEHHDHFICVGCGKIIEFEDEALETLQKRIAERYRFQTLHHRLELYGRCADCGARRRRSKRKG
jgi:Fur family ferric uptake transcriptional regulator